MPSTINSDMNNGFIIWSSIDEFDDVMLFIFIFHYIQNWWTKWKEYWNSIRVLVHETKNLTDCCFKMMDGKIRKWNADFLLLYYFYFYNFYQPDVWKSWDSSQSASDEEFERVMCVIDSIYFCVWLMRDYVKSSCP
jgi:hypothetical protein